MKNMFENDDDVVNLKATELKLGLPGRDDESEQQSSSSGKSNKRSTPEMDNSGQKDAPHSELHGGAPPPSKGQVVGWPPVRAYRKNALQQQNQKKTNVSSETATGMYVKVSMDGAPYLRKIDLKLYKSYLDLVKALESMFNCTIGKQGSDEYAPTYEDKDGDWMLVGDVPWEMFASSCKRMRIMKGSEAQGLA